ncbi:MAG: glycosyltransferase [Pseudomonadota bacterium]
MSAAIDLTLYPLSFSGGGAERVLVDLANGAAETGLQTEIVVNKPGGVLESSLKSNVGISALNVPNSIFGPVFLARHLALSRPKAMISAMPLANCSAIIAKTLSRSKCRLIISEHSVASRLYGINGLSANQRLKPIAKILYPRADHIVAVSQGASQDLSNTLGLDLKRITPIYNPVDIERVNAQAKEPCFHPWIAKRKELVIVACGRLEIPKAYDILIQAFADLQHCLPSKLIILGEGRLRRTLMDQVVSLNLSDKIDMPGFVKNPHAFISRADLFILSSRWEGFGNVLVEALACGTRIVSTDCDTGPREILEDGRYGTLVKPDNPRALTEGMLTQLRSSNTNPTALKSRAAEFSSQAAINRYLELADLV